MTWCPSAEKSAPYSIVVANDPVRRSAATVGAVTALVPVTRSSRRACSTAAPASVALSASATATSRARSTPRLRPFLRSLPRMTTSPPLFIMIPGGTRRPALGAERDKTLRVGVRASRRAPW